MTIKKKIEKEVFLRDQFISKGSDIPFSEKLAFRNVLVRFPATILNNLDERLKKAQWLSRNAWIMQAIQDKLNKDENESQS